MNFEMEVNLNKSNHSEGTVDDDTAPLEYSMSTMNTNPDELQGSQSAFNMSFGASLDLDRHAFERSRFNDSDLLGDSFAIDETPAPTTQKRVPHNLTYLDEENSQDGNEDDQNDDDNDDEERVSPQQNRPQEARIA
jgi:cobalamin biosynthesis protein CobT